MANIIDQTFLITLWCIIILIYAMITIKFIKYIFSKQIQVKAKLIDKYSSSYTKYSKSYIEQKTNTYVLKFKINDKIKSYNVSYWLYNSIQKGEETTITVKGNKLINIK